MGGLLDFTSGVDGALLAGASGLGGRTIALQRSFSPPMRELRDSLQSRHGAF